MAKVLHMPKRDSRDDPSGIPKLPKLLKFAKEEQDATVAKINGWLKLADTALADSDSPVAVIQKYK